MVVTLSTFVTLSVNSAKGLFCANINIDRANELLSTHCGLKEWAFWGRFYDS